MKALTIKLPDALYDDLAALARAFGEPGYGPRMLATDLVASELAARRLSRLSQPKPEREGEK